MLPEAAAIHVPALRGLRWLQEGFRLFTAQPGRWLLVLALWMTVMLIVPILVGTALEDTRRVALLALKPVGMDETLGGLLGILPVLGPLATVLMLPLIFSGLMVCCSAVAGGQSLHPRLLFAALQRDPSRLVTVGGINAIGQILIAEAIAWFVQDRVGELNFDIPAGPGAAQATAALLEKLSLLTPLVLPVLLLQTLLMAALWFTPPLLVFHNMTALQAVRASLQGCARNMGALSLYSLGVAAMLSMVGALTLSAGSSVVFAVIALLVLGAALTTMIASLYVSYRDIFQPHG